ncbi:hypothetical protein R50073_27140 [Maricurvus nonylphenolicus]|uniref:DUF2802 domain-containing protein n=1 Tax=Maricurvus nonylphenolicus TaxID=1008307 RepID=UPI0036F3C315
MNTEQWFDIALLGSVVVSWAAVILSLFCIRRQRQQAELTRKLYDRLDHDLQLTNSGSIGMGKRLVAMEKVLHQHAKQKADAAEAPVQQVQSVPSAVTPVHSAYNDAARLFDSGVQSEEVARRCGLSRAEASLMQLMHKQVNQQVSVA